MTDQHHQTMTHRLRNVRARVTVADDIFDFDRVVPGECRWPRFAWFWFDGRLTLCPQDLEIRQGRGLDRVVRVVIFDR